MSKVRIFALGGLDEDGKNMLVVEVDEKIFIIEAGLKYPDSETLGVEFIIPDFTYLIQNKERVKAIFITHAHDDVDAALPYLLKQINVPVYTGGMTSLMVREMLKREGVKNARVHRIKRNDTIRIAGVKVHTFPMTHAFPDNFGVAIASDQGYIVYTGEFIIDCCAAPGGKTTHMAALMHDEGRILADDIYSHKLQRIEENAARLGIQSIETEEIDAREIGEQYEAMADRVLVDAPCSGLGVLRRKPDARWRKTQQEIAALPDLQLAILESAARAVKPGGVLVYSTCTFAPAEDEGQIAAFLAKHPAFTLCDLSGCSFGRPGEANRAPDYPDFRAGYTRRIWPADGGEGHFMAKLQKAAGADAPTPPKGKPPKVPKAPAEWLDFAKTYFPALDSRPLAGAGEWLLLPAPGSETLNTAKLRVVRGGVLAGSVLKKRFQPAHALFMAYGAQCTNREELTLTDPRTAAWLRGEEIDAATAQNGWCAVLVDGFPLGGGKVSGGRIKNHYPKGLRNLQ